MELIERAKRIITDSLCLGKGETLLVVTDDPTADVGFLFYRAARELGRTALVMQMPELDVAGQEPPAAVAAAMREADVALCPTAKSITHTTARIEAAKTGTRVVTMPGITMDMLRKGASCADYVRVEKRTLRLTEKLTAAKAARIEKDGHVLTLDLDGRDGIPSPGVYRERGSSGNFPSGEAYIAPVEGAGGGTTVIDGSMVGIGKLDSPLTAVIENGRLARIEGPGSDALDILFARPENGVVAELGIGTNDEAILSGIILEDEKLFGTVHIAFGTNTSFGGTNKADCHYDGIILEPTLYLDDELVIDKGVFVGE
ncbi:aminopeptidase [Raoultibacter phocaeensis]|uniref:aminopeptidase n=1 Tax=Raoultibacter phocaeensis TaxID=2479841 RepID=UPI00111814FC|nr:aminopeptidase [Raoultibacter phocaeensis]